MSEIKVFMAPVSTMPRNMIENLDEHTHFVNQYWERVEQRPLPGQENRTRAFSQTYQ